MKVSIGILAWNEATSIAGTISSILAQSLLSRAGADLAEHVEILCLPNGCTDSTAAVAQQAFDAVTGARAGPSLTTAVHELPPASKVNAWNVFVHGLSDRDADYLILMDGDVRIEHPETLVNMVRALEQDRTARISGAHTVKHIAKKRSWNPLDRISLGAAEIRRSMPGTFAGCLYCARSDTLRAFRLPRVLIGEDVFVRAMVVTDFFTRQDVPARVITAPDATVLFEAYSSPGQIFRNLKRRAMTLTIDAILFERLWAEARPSCHGGDLVIRWDRESPQWDTRLVRRRLEENPPRARPAFHLRKWFARLGNVGRLRAVLLFPVAVAGGILDSLAESAANRSLKRGEIGGGWFTTQTRLD